MKLEPIYLNSRFVICKKVEWGDLISKLNKEYNQKTLKHLHSPEHLPTMVMHNNYFPSTIQDAYAEVIKEITRAGRRQYVDESDMHIYLSFGADAPTFGAHRDTMDVLLVQSIGRTKYYVEGLSGELVVLSPGDALYIPKGVEHEAIIMEPRATLSFELA